MSGRTRSENLMRLAFIPGKPCVFFLSFCLQFIFNVTAQQITGKENIYIDAYSLDEGLRQSMVSQVHQDKNGLIWAVTGDGVHAFNGREFQVFRIPHEGVFRSSDNMMRKLIETSPGSFIISSSVSLFSFSSSQRKFSFISKEKAIYYALFDAYFDNKPLVIIPGRDAFLIDNHHLVPLNFSSEDQHKLTGNFVPFQAVNLNKDKILVLGENGILQIKREIISGVNTFSARWKEAKGCRSMAIDRQGRIIIAMGESLYQYRENGEWIKQAELGVIAGDELMIDSHDNIWFSDSSRYRLFRFSEGRIKEMVMLIQSGKYTDTLRPDIKHIFEDKAGNIWFGTDGHGLLKYNPLKVIFEKNLCGFTRCIAAFNNNIYAGTFNRGLWKLSSDLVHASPVNPEIFSKGGYILDLVTDSYERLWVVSRNGMHVLQQDGNMIFKYPINCLTAKFIHRINDSLYFRIDNSLLTFFSGLKPEMIRKSECLPVNTYARHNDADWIGMPTGLYIRKITESQIPDFKDPPGMMISPGEIFQILKVGEEIWAATGNGIEIFSADGTIIKPGNAISELQNEVIYALQADSLGRIWCSGIGGISCISADRNRLMRFSSRHNLQSLEFNHNAACKGPDGKLYFGGINGVNGIQPARVITEKEIPEIRLFSLYVADTAFPFIKSSATPDIRLSRKAPHIQGSVFNDDYAEAAEQEFSFLLEGYQKDWSKPSSDATFSYRSLPPGEYSLLVKYTDPFKNQGKQQLLLTVTVKPAFWQTWWFLLLAVISIIVITVLVVRKIQGIRYSNRLKAIEQERAIEKERLRISKDMHDEVGASLTRISILSEIAKNRHLEPDKSQEVIQQISEIAGNVVDELSEIIWAMNSKNDSLDNFAAYMRRYAGTYLEPTCKKVKFDFPDDIPNLPMQAELRRNLFLIVKEALHNIVKHSDAENVLITLQITKNRLNLILRDDGKGFSEELLIGTGNGLYNMRRRMEECEGSFNIVSDKDKGTEIDLSVNLREKLNHTKG